MNQRQCQLDWQVSLILVTVSRGIRLHELRKDSNRSISGHLSAFRTIHDDSDGEGHGLPPQICDGVGVIERHEAYSRSAMDAFCRVCCRLKTILTISPFPHPTDSREFATTDRDTDAPGSRLSRAIKFGTFSMREAVAMSMKMWGVEATRISIPPNTIGKRESSTFATTRVFNDDSVPR